MKIDLEKTRKPLLVIAGIVATLCVLLFIPAVQNCLFWIVEKVVLHRELRRPEKWVGVIEKVCRFGFWISVFGGISLCFDKIVEKIKSIPISELKNAGIVFGLVFVFFSADFFLEFATDTYSIWAAGLKSDFLFIVKTQARFFSALQVILFQLTGLPVEGVYILSYFGGIFWLVPAVIILQYEMEKLGVKRFYSVVCSFAFIVNPFIIENFMFFYTTGFSFNIFIAVLIVSVYIRYLKNKDCKYLIFTCLGFLVITNSYQVYLTILVCLAIPFIFHYSKNIKHYFIHLFEIGFLYCFCGFASYILLKFIMHSPRFGSESTDYIANAKWAGYALFNYVFKTSLGVMPKGVFAALIIITLSALLLSLFFLKDKKFFSFLNVIILLCGIILCSTASVIAGVGYFVPRILYPFASCAALLFLNYLINFPSDNFKIAVPLKKYVSVALQVCFVIFSIIQFFSFEKIIIDKYKLNALDKYRIEMIGQKIKEYEESSNEKITAIAFYKDNIQWEQYSDIKACGEGNISSFLTSWSDLNAINYYLGVSYTKAEPKQEYKEKFATNTDTVYCEEQLIFDGDTLHILVY